MGRNGKFESGAWAFPKWVRSIKIFWIVSQTCLNLTGSQRRFSTNTTTADVFLDCKSFRYQSFYSLHHPAALFVLMYIYLCVLTSLCLCVCVRASVLDVNDETPTFNPRVYNVSLKESVPRDHIVTRLSCSDNDAGLNAELSYFITGQRSQWELFCVFVDYHVVQSWGLCAHSVLLVHPSITLWICMSGEFLLHAHFS